MTEAIRPSVDSRNNSESGRIRHNCGIAGVYAPGKDVSEILVNALSHLNHRGQEGAGVFVTNGIDKMRLIKDSGLVNGVFTEERILSLREINPTIGIGQDRYSTSGTSDAWQPFVDSSTGFALAHNGNLTNAMQLLEGLPEDQKKKAISDTWIAHKTIANEIGDSWEEKIAKGLDKMEGAYSLVMQQGDKLYAARDPWGMRPLVLGEIPGGGYIVASETSAFTPLKVKYLREVKRGERIVIDEDGVKTFSVDSRVEEVSEKKCIFEQIYVKAPDSLANGRFVSEVRYELGRMLARRDAVEALLPTRVVGVQESGEAYAKGYFEEMQKQIRTHPEQFGLSEDQVGEALDSLRMVTGLVKNTYAVNGKRVFQMPNNRERATFDKHRVNPGDIDGQKVVVVDDSEVRGTTAENIINALRTAGATYGSIGPREVHMRIGSPVITDPCFWGVDFPTHEELSSRRNSRPGASQEEMIEGMRKASGADSLKFITHTELIKAVASTHASFKGEDPYGENGFCGHCFTGIKPAEVKGVFAKPARSELILVEEIELEEEREAVLTSSSVSSQFNPLELDF